MDPIRPAFAVLALCGAAAAQPCTPEWRALSGGGLNSNVRALVAFADGAGTALFAGGTFTFAGGVPASRVARWDVAGGVWSALGTGANNTVEDLIVFNDGGGPDLYAAGWFTDAGGAPANGIARWDGGSWTTLGLGMSSPFGPVVYALAVFDDGAGPALYAGGPFTTAGGAPASRIAKWNGLAWSALGAGVNSSVNALAVFNDGTGAALYAGGTFDTAGGASANGIAKWNGQSWSALGTGTVGAVRALVVFDDGGGPDLYAGGEFISAGGVAGTSRVARWSGQAWSALGTGFDDTLEDLAVFNDGSGAALYAGGWFSQAGGAAASRIARWDGLAWSALGSGMNIGTVNDLLAFNDGGSALYVVGGFTTAGGVPAERIARWGCPPPAPCYANCDHSTTAPVLNVADFSCFLGKFAVNDPYANCDGSTQAPILNVQDFSCFLQRFAAGCP
jgi:hypothetical protein